MPASFHAWARGLLSVMLRAMARAASAARVINLTGFAGLEQAAQRRLVPTRAWDIRLGRPDDRGWRRRARKKRKRSGR
jgi:hypothetical protein